ncbi:MAG: MATE family efflux transporter [Lachnospiraceae bacterium]|nr:MATE family efflux transporter [Lachnospiraceae bacterium]
MFQKSAKQDLLHENIFKTLILFAVPFMLSSVMQMLYNTVDTIVVGQFVGSAGISAVASGGNLVNLSITVCTGFSTAGQILVAQFVGAGKRNEVKKAISTLAFLIGISAIAMGIIVIIFLKPLLNLMSTPAEAFQMAVDYMVICAGGMIFTAFYNMLSAVFRGMGDSRHPFIFIAIASVTNILLDLLFTGLFKWGTAGCAWATIIGQAVSVAISLVFLLRHKEEYCCDFKRGEFRIYPEAAAAEVQLGLPMMLCGSAVTISVLFVNTFINKLGVIVSAAFGVGMRIYHIPNTIAMSISQAAAAMMGQNLGAGQYDRVKQVVRSSIVISSVIQVFFMVILLLFPRTAFGIFTNEEAVLDYALRWFIAMAIGMPAMVTMGTFNSLIIAVGDTKISMLIGIADAVVGRIASTLLLGVVLNLGAMGLFVGYSLGVYVSAIPGALYYFLVNWKERGLRISQGVN